MNKNIAIIGAGNLGISLASLFIKNGYDVVLGSRNPDQAKATLLTAQQNASGTLLDDLIIKTPEKAVKEADINLLTVIDGAIQNTCDTLAKHFKHGSIVAHCSGALNSDVLKSAHAQGCFTSSVHPLNTFPNIDAALQLLSNNQHNTFLYCEGDQQALEPLQLHFKQLGFNPIEISAENKPLYHAACVFACNYLTVLMDLSLQTAEAATLDRDVFLQAIQPLVQSTLNNINTHGTTASLSGPIARGDSETLTKHLAELNSVSEDIRDTYANLGTHAIKLAKNNKYLDLETINNLKKALNKS